MHQGESIVVSSSREFIHLYPISQSNTFFSRSRHVVTLSRTFLMRKDICTVTRLEKRVTVEHSKTKKSKNEGNTLLE
jgi:hypothetical protein